MQNTRTVRSTLKENNNTTTCTATTTITTYKVPFFFWFKSLYHLPWVREREKREKREKKTTLTSISYFKTASSKSFRFIFYFNALNQFWSRNCPSISSVILAALSIYLVPTFNLIPNDQFTRLLPTTFGLTKSWRYTPLLLDPLAHHDQALSVASSSRRLR